MTDNNIVTEMLTDAYSQTIEEQVKIFTDTKIKEGIEEILVDDDAVEEEPAAAIMAAGFLKTIYLMERIYAERQDLIARLEGLEK